jgi:hypothetical protein
MKRSTIAVLALVALVAAAGSALAYGSYGFDAPHVGRRLRPQRHYGRLGVRLRRMRLRAGCDELGIRPTGGRF